MTNITFQGALGAYSHIACENIFPNGNYIPADTFEDAMELVKNNKADYAVIPIENSNAGRVTDVYFLLYRTAPTPSMTSVPNSTFLTNFASPDMVLRLNAS